MDRRITFKGVEGRFDIPTFLLSENESLFIQVDVPKVHNVLYFLVIKHGEQKKNVWLTNIFRRVELTAEWLNAGGTGSILFELEMRDRAGVTVYKKYHIEPLEINAAEVGTEYSASLQSLENKNAELSKSLAAAIERIAKLEEEVSKIPGKIKKAKNEAIVAAAGGDPMGA